MQWYEVKAYALYFSRVMLILAIIGVGIYFSFPKLKEFHEVNAMKAAERCYYTGRCSRMDLRNIQKYFDEELENHFEERVILNQNGITIIDKNKWTHLGNDGIYVYKGE